MRHQRAVHNGWRAAAPPNTTAPHHHTTSTANTTAPSPSSAPSTMDGALRHPQTPQHHTTTPPAPQPPQHHRHHHTTTPPAAPPPPARRPQFRQPRTLLGGAREPKVRDIREQHNRRLLEQSNASVPQATNASQVLQDQRADPALLTPEKGTPASVLERTTAQAHEGPLSMPMAVVVRQLANLSGSTSKHVKIRILQTIQLKFWSEALCDQSVCLMYFRENVNQCHCSRHGLEIVDSSMGSSGVHFGWRKSADVRPQHHHHTTTPPHHHTTAARPIVSREGAGLTKARPPLARHCQGPPASCLTAGRRVHTGASKLPPQSRRSSWQLEFGSAVPREPLCADQAGLTPNPPRPSVPACHGRRPPPEDAPERRRNAPRDCA